MRHILARVCALVSRMSRRLPPGIRSACAHVRGPFGNNISPSSSDSSVPHPLISFDTAPKADLICPTAVILSNLESSSSTYRSVMAAYRSPRLRKYSQSGSGFALMKWRSLQISENGNIDKEYRTQFERVRAQHWAEHTVNRRYVRVSEAK